MTLWSNTYRSYLLATERWTGLAEIFNGSSPFGDGEVEALNGFPEGFDLPQMAEALQEYSPGFY